MAESMHRFPGYDVLAKRDTPSWNPQTRRVIEERLALPPQAHGFFTEAEWRTLNAVCARILPQPPDRADPVPIAALLDQQMQQNRGDGFRQADMPPLREAWRRGLAAIEAEARLRHGAAFHALAAAQQDALLHSIQQGEVRAAEWQGLPVAHFFKARLLHDIVDAYYAHPTAWNEIGFGGPASPRGYVRMGFDRRDPWEAVERKP
ncbi:gluconate 2-dehydrogenase subunit 3 family protein [Siccirubricoccus sp. G192]|uniref:gluconate 2-dehydrogenase subunit 3 family protein n=1 Tax=Siccirubricoccus sp. G192 TaxID=2849651 RepID=UPI001C2C5586|nr:gluconate 2-dehydrogenase subunit 3 family protein [Siccirubricoccus sp. G192]MBV1795671.1 gluconate 2-dehydrogenase subunit 3 family protein [Siccirubricoccus sp. G192]